MAFFAENCACGDLTCAVVSQSSLQGLDRVLVLDRIQDPGNLGTILRTASGLGWTGIFLLNGCCDPFNDKSIRAARGAAWNLKLCEGDWSHLMDAFTEASPGKRRAIVKTVHAGGLPWLLSDAPPPRFAGAESARLGLVMTCSPSRSPAA